MGFSHLLIVSALLVCGAFAGLPSVAYNYGPKIDPYPSYDPQNSCVSATQVGTAAIKSFWQKSFPGVGSGIGTLRACSDGDRSEHKEGRAMDYMLDATNHAQAAVAKQVIDWLLATDFFGNRHAMARRMGLMYMIWNNKIFGLYRTDDGWRNYSVGGVDCSKLGASYKTACHRDHIHMSFSWAGARRAASFFTKAITPANDVGQYIGCYVDRSTARDLVGPSWSSSTMTITKCRAYCGGKGYKYAGLQAGKQCFCDNSYGSYGRGTAASCRTACSGSKTTKCGGSLRNSVYKAFVYGNPVPARICAASAQTLRVSASASAAALALVPRGAQLFDLKKPLYHGWRAVGYRQFNGWVPAGAVVSC